jgi:hypothetical protein
MIIHGKVRTSLAAIAIAAIGTAAQASVEISSKPTHNMSCTDGVCAPTAERAFLNATDLSGMLAAGDVKVVTGNGASTITVSAPFSWASSSRLTLDAIYNVSFRAPVEVTGQGAVTIVTNDGGTGGDLIFFDGGSLDFWDLSSSLIVNVTSYTLVNDLPSLVSDIQANPAMNIALAKNYKAKLSGKFVGVATSNTFTGTLEGLGHAISNLRFVEKSKQATQAGLFAAIGPAGLVRDLGLTDSSTSGHVTDEYNQLALLVVSNAGTINRSFVTGNIKVTGDDGAAGGIAALNNGTIINSYANVSVSGGTRRGAAGDLVGSNEGEIADCYAFGTVDLQAGSVGGLVGVSSNDDTFSALITGSHATGNVSGASAGGLVGFGGWGTITESYATGTVSGGPGGGLVGTNIGVIQSSFATGAVSGFYEAGGLVGVTDGGTIKNSNATGAAVTEVADGVGGLVGEIYAEQTSADIESSYSTGSPSGPGMIGGFIGNDAYYPNSHLASDYWDFETSQIQNPSQGAGNVPNDPGLMGLSDRELKSRLPAGFDPGIWAVSKKINNGYPHLIANLPPQ